MNENFILRATLESPLLIQDDSPLSLDALLAAALYQQTGDLTVAHSEIPLSRTGPVWHGSSAFFYTPSAQAPTPVERTFIGGLNPIREGEMRHCTATGRFFRDRMPNQTTVDVYRGWAVQQVIWFGHGNAQACQQCIATLPAIGKKKAQGNGRISKVSVEPLNAHRAFVLPDGTPARPIPVPLWNQLQQVIAAEKLPQDFVALEPPYWATQACELSVIPRERYLSSAHMRYMNTGWHHAWPNDYRSHPRPQIRGLDFFYERLGRDLFARVGIPGEPVEGDCSLCGSTQNVTKAGGGYARYCQICITFGGQYEGIKRPGRMGAGWAGLISPSQRTLVTSVDYGKARPFMGYTGVELRCGKQALREFLPSLIERLPEPPFLWFYSAHSVVKVAKALTVSGSARLARRAGAPTWAVDLVRVREAFHRWLDSDIPAAKINQAIGRLTQQQMTGSSDEALATLYDDYPQLAALLPTLPKAYTSECACLRQLMNDHERNG